MKKFALATAGGAAVLIVGLTTMVQMPDVADARTVNVTRSNVARSNVARPNVTRSNVTRSNVTRSNVTRSNVTRSNVTRSNVTRSNVTRSNVTRSNLNRPNSITRTNVGKTSTSKNLGNITKNNPGIQFGPKGLKGPKGPTGISAVGPKGPKGPYINVVGAPKGPNVTLINNRNINIFRGPRSIWWNGRLRTLVALGVLGGIYVGGTYLIADGYVPVAYPACRGITVEGCSLTWRDVPTDDGGVIAQCVQFCPRRVASAVDTPVLAAPAAAPVPAAMAQGCEISIHAEPNFGGVNSDVTADQPQLNQYGWDKAISSINVKSGTWDFYSDDNYGGQMIRLGPGQYPTLAQGWDKTINSLMCAQP